MTTPLAPRFTDALLSPAELERQKTVACLLKARLRSHDPSERIALALAAALVESNAPVATAADYPGWAEHIAALQAANRTARKEATA
ncbi:MULTISPECIES: hypothetical protein [Streptomyces]|uniref:Uncharacterized protein n=2 Tax=Streptomyces TaxID=1883 RepID=A0A2U9P011_STRAS|nr:hypothetical protein [Streptomyces actuosus]AWT42614.1 hypothetical protein DMT42_10000 [Streptomyces actuosus]MBM4819829.1 hypothetical protein [Streptomyces actuosus]